MARTLIRVGLMQSIQALKGNQVHLWQIDLNQMTEQDSVERTVLTQDELVKINRLHQLKHRQRSFSMRTQLRLLLAAYLNQSASNIQFTYDQFGKPQLKNTPLFFNISHSQNTALVAISHNDQMGVDIEHWRVVEQMQAIVNRHYSVSEKKAWQLLNTVQHESVFFNIWTCKEAFIKATGRGLGMGLSRCGFNLRDNYQVENCPIEYGDASQWCCVPLLLGERLSGALILKADDCHASMYSFDPQFPPQIV